MARGVTSARKSHNQDAAASYIGAGIVFPGGGVPLVSGTITRLNDEVGAIYTAASVLPSGAPIQWTRTLFASPYTTTDIAGQTGATYTSQVGDVGYRIGYRGQSGAKSVKAAAPVLAASLLIDDFESTTGRTTGAGWQLSLDTTHFKQGAASFVVQNTVNQTGDAIVNKTISGLDISTFGIVSALTYHDAIFGQASTRAQFVVAGITLSAEYLGWTDTNPVGFYSLLADTADVAAPIGVQDGVSRVRHTAKAPSTAKTTMDNFRARMGHVPTILWINDDTYRGPYTRTLAQWEAAGMKQNFAIGTDNLQPTLNGTGFLCNADVLDIDARGHGVMINFSKDDSGPTTAGTVATYVANALSAKAILQGIGVSNRCLDHGVYSNGAFSLPYNVGRAADAIHDGAGNISLTAVPSPVPAVGNKFRGWDITTTLPVTATITAVTDSTHFKVDYNFPANSAGNSVSKRGVWWDDGEFFSRKLPDALRTAGFKTGRATTYIDPPIFNARHGIPEPLMMPSQGFTGGSFATFQTYIDKVIKFKGVGVIYVHDHILPGTQGINVYAADVNQIATNYASAVAAGNLWFPAIDEFWDAYGNARPPA